MLAHQFGVSRITIRNALKDLVEKNLIYRIQGRGTYISIDATGEPYMYKAESIDSTDSNRQNDVSYNKKKLVAYLIPRLNKMFSVNLLNEIEDGLSKHGYHLVFCKTHDSQETEEQILREVVQLGVEGIIIYPVEGKAYSEEILRLTLTNFPLVVIDRYLRGVDTNCVCSDNFQGAYKATFHLIELCHSKIGFISTRYQGTTSLEDRLCGYEKALSDHNIPIDYRLRLVELRLSDENYRSQIKTFLQQNRDMTAVVAANSEIGLQIMEVAGEIGIRVPEDLSVVLFDHEERLLPNPPTYINQQEKSLAQEAVKLLLSTIENPTQKRCKIELPAILTVRSSTAICRKEDVIP